MRRYPTKQRLKKAISVAKIHGVAGKLTTQTHFVFIVGLAALITRNAIGNAKAEIVKPAQEIEIIGAAAFVHAKKFIYERISIVNKEIDRHQPLIHEVKVAQRSSCHVGHRSCEVCACELLKLPLASITRVGIKLHDLWHQIAEIRPGFDAHAARRPEFAFHVFPSSRGKTGEIGVDCRKIHVEPSSRQPPIPA